ncbi:MAG: DUF1045 domain-containing protein [Burkholderiaceae bacterium]
MRDPYLPTALTGAALKDSSQSVSGPARYALYFTPVPYSTWSAAGCRWLGRDAYTGLATAQLHVTGLTAACMADLTASPRRYGFHATLKAPFTLAQGWTEARLLTMAEVFCRSQPPVRLHGLGVRPLGSFLALNLLKPASDVGALAQRCVDHFDCLRSPPSAEELTRRRQAGLNPREDALLMRWGYPFTEEAFRFHMTLSNNLASMDQRTVAALHHAAKRHFADVLAEPLCIDGLAVFKEAERGAPFRAIQRFAFLDQLQGI